MLSLFARALLAGPRFSLLVQSNDLWTFSQFIPSVHLVIFNLYFPSFPLLIIYLVVFFVVL